VIVVFGSLNVDGLARVPRLPRDGDTLTALDYTVAAGGKGANQALAARRAGAQVHQVGSVGRDAQATEATRLLRDDGVVLDGVVATDAPTGLAWIHVDPAGANTITVIPGANALARAADVPDHLLAPGCTLLMQLEVPLPQVEALAARARSRGVRVMLNAAPAAALPPALLAAVDVLVVNENEAAALAGGKLDSWCAARERAGCMTVVTLGAHGARTMLDGSLRTLPAPHVDAVDTVGAGDAFTGALAAALDRGAPREEALREALAAGALACTTHGAQPAMPRREDIVALAARSVASTTSRT
jgi:ribokinase